MLKIYIDHHGLYTLVIGNLHCEGEISTAYRGSMVAIGRVRSLPVLGQICSVFALLCWSEGADQFISLTGV